MNVYVGMGVHHKRSQIAVVDGAGVPSATATWANDPAKLIPVLGVLAPGTPVAFEAASGWGWLVELLAVAHQGWMVGATNWPLGRWSLPPAEPSRACRRSRFRCCATNPPAAASPSWPPA